MFMFGKQNKKKKEIMWMTSRGGSSNSSIPMYIKLNIPRVQLRNLSSWTGYLLALDIAGKPSYDVSLLQL